MLFTTLPQLIALVVLFCGGLVLGLGLHPGGKKWRRRFTDESGNYAQFRRDADKQFRESKRRIDELEREKAELQDREAAARHGQSETEMKLAAVSDAPSDQLEQTAALDAEPEHEPEPVEETPKKSWFTMGAPTDLGRLRGIDAELKTRLFGLGVTRYEDITDLSAEDEMALEQRLSLPAGYITREQWREQAALLQAGQQADHAERFPPA